MQDESDSNISLKVSLNQNSLTTSGILYDTTEKEKEDIPLILRRINSRSPMKTCLSHILGKFHSYPLLLIMIEIFLGLLFIGLPIFFIIYLNIFENKIISFLIIILLSLIFSLGIMIIRYLDDKKHNLSSLVKWQRNNLASNFGISLNLLILILPAFFIFKLYNDLQEEFCEHKGKDDVKMNYFYSFIIDLYYFTHDKNNMTCGDNNYLKDDKINNIIKDNLFYASIPLFIICFFKIVKGILIKMKYYLEHIIFYLIIFIFCLLNIILYKNEIKNEVISLTQLIVIILLLLIYIIWIIHSFIIKIKYNKDKCFGIRKYKKRYLWIILLFDILLFAGTSIILTAFIFYYSNYIKINESFVEINIIKLLLKLGLGLSSLGFTYYYGHHLMKMIMKPISFEFIPSELMDENFIKINKDNKFKEFIFNLYKRKIQSKNN